MNPNKIILFILFYSIIFCLFSQTEHRKALLIGNKDYVYYNKLKNSIRDVDAMNTALKGLGFETTVKKNLEYRNMSSALNAFVANLKPNDIALIYYSGHGIGHNGYNFMLPIEESFNCLNELEDLIPISINRVVKSMEQKGVKNSFVFLDACRNLPNFKDCSGEKGINKVGGLVIPNNNPKGNLIFFATTEGNTADDDTYDNTNSLFTSELLKYITIPDLTIRTIVDKVTNGVEQRSNSKQIPQKLEDMRGDFYFIKTSDEEKARIALLEKQKEEEAIKIKIQQEYDRKLKEEIAKLENDKKIVEKDKITKANIEKAEKERLEKENLLKAQAEKEKIASRKAEEVKLKPQIIENKTTLTSKQLFENEFENANTQYALENYKEANLGYTSAKELIKNCKDCAKNISILDQNINNVNHNLEVLAFKKWQTTNYALAGISLIGIGLFTNYYVGYNKAKNDLSVKQKLADPNGDNIAILSQTFNDNQAYDNYVEAYLKLNSIKRDNNIYNGVFVVGATIGTFYLVKKIIGKHKPDNLNIIPYNKGLSLSYNF